METRLRPTEKKIIAFECVVIVVTLALAAYGVYEIWHGSLWAVAWSVCLFAIEGSAIDDVHRIISYAKRRDGNANR